LHQVFKFAEAIELRSLVDGQTVPVCFAPAAPLHEVGA
jgi:hypothetical protein